MSRASASRTIYVGNLPGDIREREVEDLFHKYGRIVDIDLKVPPRPPGYAFVEFESSRDADDAIRGRDGYNFDGHRLRVELAHGGRGHASSYDRRNNYSSGGGSRGGVSRRSDYRVLVTGLPSSASWQDLKDHMRQAGDVCFSQVFRDGSGTTGIVDYTNYDDMKYAIKKLDDSEFRNAFSRAYVRVREYDGKRSRSRSLSRSHSRSRSYSRSRSASRSPKNSRSRSISKSPKVKPSRRSVSKSRSRSISSVRSGSKPRSPSRCGIMRRCGDCMLGIGWDLVRMYLDPLLMLEAQPHEEKKLFMEYAEKSRSRSKSPAHSPVPRREQSRSPRKSASRSRSLSRSPAVRSDHSGSGDSRGH